MRQAEVDSMRQAERELQVSGYVGQITDDFTNTS